jgi:predicted nucleic acid-binding protein
MSDKVVYLDSSAFAKLFVQEPESGALRSYLAQRVDKWVSASLLRTEALRVAQRLSPRHVAAARGLLRDVAYVELERGLMDRAGILHPLEMRSLDAVHLCAALTLGADLDAVVTYDDRLRHAAQQQGLAVVSPS